MNDAAREPTISNRTTACGMGCGGCGLVYLLFVTFFVPNVLDPYIVHKKRIPTCRSFRKTILEFEQIYKDNNPKHQYTTDFAVLRKISDARRVSAGIYECPDGGTYRIVQTGKKLVIDCTARDHLPVSQE